MQQQKKQNFLISPWVSPKIAQISGGVKIDPKNEIATKYQGFVKNAMAIYTAFLSSPKYSNYF